MMTIESEPSERERFILCLSYLYCIAQKQEDENHALEFGHFAFFFFFLVNDYPNYHYPTVVGNYSNRQPVD